MQGECLIEECALPVKTRGWCIKHYTRWLRTGDPLRTTAVPHRAPLDEKLRFTGWTEIIRRPDLGPCWEWNGRRTGLGYGRTSGHRASGGPGTVFAHRNAYEAWVGPIPAGLVVRHRCDNPPCINPTHLLVGTSADNTADSVARQRRANGERSPQHRLTDDQVSEIRAKHAAGGVTQRALARDYDISVSQMSNIIRRIQRKTATNSVLA
ncbi:MULTISPECIES: HNH endonuclease [unclassified Cryobacterium]|uniref:HNH endonuclease n=1 Tax=unclassified Cryobacterium TaxID=2649013 RepID=UPI0010696C3E|nr:MULTISPECIES: HNH endonuclease [unclassified Cryobacterium]TFC59422.1 hypothetical protein E3O68_00540 [Cryobacterium sp. TMB3-1-2]TFC67218.1 hypothetical protein E3T21_17235 [Cryobacterium sp. TMB3-15]TFC73269.1 hypothetical protein E3T22_16820 [Cryobacterium sp. TMB3-10]TFD46157.1 hypothetical protein E3T58_01455 [Cryobacterium sp. TMB3-12]